MTRRLSFVIAGALLSTQTTAQLVVMMIVNYISLVVHLSARPYVFASDNQFQVITDMIAFFACFGGMLFLTASLDESATSTLTAFYIAIFAIVAFLVIVFCVVKVREFFIWIRERAKLKESEKAKLDDIMYSRADTYDHTDDMKSRPTLWQRFRRLFRQDDAEKNPFIDLAPADVVRNPVYGMQTKLRPLQRLDSRLSVHSEDMSPSPTPNPMFGRSHPSIQPHTPVNTQPLMVRNPLQRLPGISPQRTLQSPDSSPSLGMCYHRI